MARKADYEETKQDMTSMIDVVFLLIIFFILMPPKQMEKQLQAYLPQDGGPPPIDTKEPPPPEPKFTILLTAEPQGDEVSTAIIFNNRPVCKIVSLSIGTLDKIYAMGVEPKRLRLEEESKRDEKTLDPLKSADLHLLIQRMSDASLGSAKGKETTVIIDAAYNVPFKVVLAVLNAGAGAGFKNINFAAPSMDIWKQAP